MNPRQISPASSSPDCCSCLQVQLLLPWATAVAGTGHQAVRHPSWGHTLGPAPSLSCPAVHLTFTHFIKHLLRDALLASLLSKNKHCSPQGRGINHQRWQKHHVPGSSLEAVARPHHVSSDIFGAGWAAMYGVHSPGLGAQSLSRQGLSFRTSVRWVLCLLASWP